MDRELRWDEACAVAYARSEQQQQARHAAVLRGAPRGDLGAQGGGGELLVLRRNKIR